MSKARIWLMIAAALIALGLILFVIVMTANRWDFTKLGTGKSVTTTYEIGDEFSSISVRTGTADVLLLPSEDEACKVVCYEQKSMKHTVSVTDGVLNIHVDDTRKWYEYINIFAFTSPMITVYLPKAEYSSLFIEASTGDIEIAKNFNLASMDISTSTGDVKAFASASECIKVKTSTGNIRIENVSAGALDLSVSTGNITAASIRCEGDVKVSVSTGDTTLTDVSCKSVTSSGDTGDISLRNVIATERFSIERDTGDVTFEGCDAAEIFVETDTGDVEGSLLTEKVFIIKTDTGNINVPNSITGGRCEITTDTGDIRIRIQQ